VAQRKRLLILTIDAGFGHRSAAKAIAAAIEEMGGEAVEVTVLNPLEHKRIPSVLRNGQADYDWLVRELPGLYRMTYQATDTAVPSRIVERAAGLFFRQVVRDTLLHHRPDLIIATFPVYQAALGPMLQQDWLRAPLFTVVTDLVMVHRWWFHKAADLYLVPTPAVRDQAVQQGLDPALIRVTGVPVHPDLAREARPPAAVRAELGWRPDLLTVLAVGSKRVSRLAGVLSALNHSGWPLQIVAVAGGDDRLYGQLQAEEWHVPAHIVDLADNMPALLHAADCIICKAGGVLVSEALACGLPLLLIDALPGQEVGNARYVVSGGAGELVTSPLAALQVMAHWLARDGQLLRARAEAARALGRPRAAHDVAALALAALTKP
jgi:1,2-diacylglycerol 3-beta-galactosyltransferase